ncbi:hypothetical protein ACW6QP_03240 [Salegentibacter sp. HM20]
MLGIKIIFLISIFLVSACKNQSGLSSSTEINNVLEAFASKSTTQREFFFRTLQNTNTYYKKPFQVISEPGSIMINQYNEGYIAQWKKESDTAKSKESKDEIAKKYKIQPEQVFKPEDREYMLAQLENLRSLDLRNFNIKNLSLQNSEDFPVITQPIFNKAHNRAVIFIISKGYEGLEVYKKGDGKWDFYFASTLLIE